MQRWLHGTDAMGRATRCGNPACYASLAQPIRAEHARLMVQGFRAIVPDARGSDGYMMAVADRNSRCRNTAKQTRPKRVFLFRSCRAHSRLLLYHQSGDRTHRRVKMAHSYVWVLSVFHYVMRDVWVVHVLLASRAASEPGIFCHLGMAKNRLRVQAPPEDHFARYEHGLEF